MIKKISLISIFSLVLLSCFAQTKTEASAIRSKMQWFADAKLGIFIHAGIYSVKEWMNPGVFIIEKSAMQII